MTKKRPCHCSFLVGEKKSEEDRQTLIGRKTKRKGLKNMEEKKKGGGGGGDHMTKKKRKRGPHGSNSFFLNPVNQDSFIWAKHILSEHPPQKQSQRTVRKEKKSTISHEITNIK